MPLSAPRSLAVCKTNVAGNRRTLKAIADSFACSRSATATRQSNWWNSRREFGIITGLSATSGVRRGSLLNRMTPSPTRLIQSSTVEAYRLAIHGLTGVAIAQRTGCHSATSLPSRRVWILTYAHSHNFPSTGIYSSRQRATLVCLRYDPRAASCARRPFVPPPVAGRELSRSGYRRSRPVAPAVVDQSYVTGQMPADVGQRQNFGKPF